jgi:hypothetical protein
MLEWVFEMSEPPLGQSDPLIPNAIAGAAIATTPNGKSASRTLNRRADPDEPPMRK